MPTTSVCTRFAATARPPHAHQITAAPTQEHANGSQPISVSRHTSWSVHSFVEWASRLGTGHIVKSHLGLSLEVCGTIHPLGGVYLCATKGFMKERKISPTYDIVIERRHVSSTHASTVAYQSFHSWTIMCISMLDRTTKVWGRLANHRHDELFQHQSLRLTNRYWRDTPQ